jgi:hypothetical protein
MSKRHSASKSTFSLAPFLILLVIGFLSGLLSALIIINSLGSFTFLIVPGVLFGCGIACYFLFFQQVHSFKKLLRFIAISEVAYLLSFFTFAAVGNIFNFPNDVNTIPLGVFSGAVGTLLLLYALHKLLMPLRREEWYTLILFVIIVSALDFSLMAVITSPGKENYGLDPNISLPFFVTWQTGMAGAIGWIISSRKTSR